MLIPVMDEVMDEMMIQVMVQVEHLVEGIIYPAVVDVGEPGLGPEAPGAVHQGRQVERPPDGNIAIGPFNVCNR